MAVKKKSKKAKKSTKAKKEKKPTLTRKSFILDMISKAGKKGVSPAKLIEATDDKFGYGDGRSSSARVKNTIREGVEEGILKQKENGTVSAKK